MISNEKTYLFLLAFMIFSSASLCKYFFICVFFPVSYLICCFFSVVSYFFILLLFAFFVNICIVAHMHIAQVIRTHSRCVIILYIHIFIHLHIAYCPLVLSEERLMLIGMERSVLFCFVQCIPIQVVSRLYFAFTLKRVCACARASERVRIHTGGK